MPELVSMGECMVELFAPQPLADAPSFTKSFGGDTLNLLVMASRLGTAAGYVTYVGDDPFGKYLVTSWRREGVDTSEARTIPGFTGLYVMAQQLEGEREIVYYRTGSAASKLNADRLPLDYLRSARVLHLSGITQAISPSARCATLEAARIAREAGLRVSFDINYRPRLWAARHALEAMDEIIPYVDVLFPSMPEDTRLFLGMDSPEAVAAHFRERGVAIVALKAGDRGAYVAWEGGAQWVPAYRTKVVDATGAGDAFGGAFLHALLHDLDPPDAALVATVAAGLKVERPGAVAGLPTRREVAEALNGRLELP